MGVEASKTEKFSQFKVDLEQFQAGETTQHQVLGSVKLYKNLKTNEEVMVKEVLIPEDHEMFQKYIQKMQKVMAISHQNLLRIIGTSSLSVVGLF